MCSSIKASPAVAILSSCFIRLLAASLAPGRQLRSTTALSVDGNPKRSRPAFPAMRRELGHADQAATMESIAATTALSVDGDPKRSRPAFPAMRKELRRILTAIDWDTQTKLPPWLSPIKEGAEQGVAVVLGQSLKPDGSAPQVLTDRAKMAKTLFDQKKIVKVIVSGGDPAGVGRTEASVQAAVLQKAGIPKELIIQESQALTTAENAWFTLRWMPMGTGQLYIITSDFHMARAAYIFQETFNYFYMMVEDSYRDDPQWKSKTKKYPRLAINQVPVKSFCGSDADLSSDHDKRADINSKSLAFRATSELTYLGSKEVGDAMFGEPLRNIMYIWPVQINVTEDPENKANFQAAVAQQMNVVKKLCACRAPPEKGGTEVEYPLKFPLRTTLPAGETIEDWQKTANACSQFHDQRKRAHQKSGSSAMGFGFLYCLLALGRVFSVLTL